MSPGSEEKKAQPSIHAFFKRKTPPPSPTVLRPAKVANRNSGSSRQDPVLFDDDEEPTILDKGVEKLINGSSSKSNGVVKEENTNAKAPATSSSYFTKPAPTSTTSAAPTNGHRSASASSSLAAYRRNGSAIPHSSQSGSAFDAFSFAKSSNAANVASSSTQGAERTLEQQRRHEQWQKRLSGPNGLVPRRRSLRLDEAAAAEARKAAGLDVEEAEGADTPGPIEVDNYSADVEDQSEKAAEGLSGKLKKFAAKGSEAGKGKNKGKKKEESLGPSGLTYTPLEKQYMEIKAENQDVLLFMEVGYKYLFHGDDAKIAAKELGIACFPHRNFYTASIPTHRLHIHTKKLISLGYKVGVVSQMETAALKKISENRNAPFTRKLTHLFTAATYVEDPSLPSSSTLTDDPVLPGSAPPPTNALVAVVEMGMGGMSYNERVRIGLVSVVPGTGEVVWDEFDDAQVRTELETRLTHLAPAELLLPAKGLSKATEKVLGHFTGPNGTASGSSIRVERITDVPEHAEAFDFLTKFYKQKRPVEKQKGRNGDHIDLTFDSDDEAEAESSGNHQGDVGEAEDPVGLAAGLPSEQAVLALVEFPKQVVIALAVAVKYMKSFGLENAFRHRSSFVRFINRAHMLLSSNTLLNLEIYKNQTDGGMYGSLLWLLDHTKTRMGRRLLREWIGRPLLDVGALQARIDAIDEILRTNTYHIEKLRSLLVNMPDLIRGLTRIQYGKATPSEVATILVGLDRVGGEFKGTEGNVFQSALLNAILKALPTIKEPARAFLNALNLKTARENDETGLWNDADKYPEVQDAKDCISVVDSELDQHLRDIRKTLKRPSLQYVTVAGIEFLVEAPIRDAKSVPPKWAKVQATKSVVRFHTPEVLRMTKEREQHKETLAAAAKRAFLSFQADISQCHSLVVVSRQLAVIDCLFSLAQVAAASGYCKPIFVAAPELHIRDGRHPMVEMLRDEAYVPFDIDFSEKDGCARVITGPNMAGKSSCVRATALIVCMAQIGSFVPASQVTLGIHDAVQTRMGASDEIGRGKSTFMVELSETSDILRTLTPRTLVILDELGRGTSTYDGVAIAYATLSHVAKIGCNTLFVTHYPMVAEELAKEFPGLISNWHMSFSETRLPDGSAEIIFLYKLTRGLAEASFGVWCARLAGLPKTVLENAQLRSDMLKVETQQRLLLALTKRSKRLLHDITSSNTPAFDTLRNITVLHKALNLVCGKV